MSFSKYVNTFVYKPSKYRKFPVGLWILLVSILLSIFLVFYSSFHFLTSTTSTSTSTLSSLRPSPLSESTGVFSENEENDNTSQSNLYGKYSYKDQDTTQLSTTNDFLLKSKSKQNITGGKNIFLQSGKVNDTEIHLLKSNDKYVGENEQAKKEVIEILNNLDQSEQTVYQTIRSCLSENKCFHSPFPYLPIEGEEVQMTTTLAQEGSRNPNDMNQENIKIEIERIGILGLPGSCNELIYFFLQLFFREFKELYQVSLTSDNTKLFNRRRKYEDGNDEIKNNHHNTILLGVVFVSIPPFNTNHILHTKNYSQSFDQENNEQKKEVEPSEHILKIDEEILFNHTLIPSIFQKRARKQDTEQTQQTARSLHIYLSSHVPPYGYGRNHGYSKIIRPVKSLSFHILYLLFSSKVFRRLYQGHIDNLKTIDSVNETKVGKFGNVKGISETETQVSDLRDTLRLLETYLKIFINAQTKQLLTFHCRCSHVAAHTMMLSPFIGDKNLRESGNVNLIASEKSSTTNKWKSSFTKTMEEVLSFLDIEVKDDKVQKIIRKIETENVSLFQKYLSDSIPNAFTPRNFDFLVNGKQNESGHNFQNEQDQDLYQGNREKSITSYEHHTKMFVLRNVQKSIEEDLEDTKKYTIWPCKSFHSCRIQKDRNDSLNFLYVNKAKNIERKDIEKIKTDFMEDTNDGLLLQPIDLLPTCSLPHVSCTINIDTEDYNKNVNKRFK